MKEIYKAGEHEKMLADKGNSQVAAMHRGDVYSFRLGRLGPLYQVRETGPIDPFMAGALHDELGVSPDEHGTMSFAITRSGGIKKLIARVVDCKFPVNADELKKNLEAALLN